MPLDRRLLDILCCPVTKVPVRPLRPDELARVNAEVRAGRLLHANDEPVAAELQEALVTENGERLYPVEDGIPIMLEERAIGVRDLGIK